MTGKVQLPVPQEYHGNSRRKSRKWMNLIPTPLYTLLLRKSDEDTKGCTAHSGPIVLTHIMGEIAQKARERCSLFPALSHVGRSFTDPRWRQSGRHCGLIRRQAGLTRHKMTPLWGCNVLLHGALCTYSRRDASR